MKQHMMNRLMLLSFVIIATIGTIVVGVGTQRVLAWMGPDDWGSVSNTFETGCCLTGANDWSGVSQGGWNQNCCGDEGYGLSLYQIGWNNGAADAQFDHLHGLVYNNGPACDSCHTPLYLDGFHKGYSAQWNIYQNTEQVQKSQQTANNYVSINGDNNKVYLNDRQSQNSEQEDQTSNTNTRPDNNVGTEPYQQQQQDP